MPDLDPSFIAVRDMLRAAFPTVSGQLVAFVGGIVNDSGQPATPPMQGPPNGDRVAPHVVMYPQPGTAVSLTLSGGLQGLTGDAFQVTAVGASPRDALNAAQAVRAALLGQPAGDDDHAGVIYETAAGALVRDQSINPNRWQVPIVFGTVRG